MKDLDDEAAFMELVLANNQGELSPLEYGMHVLKYVELSEGGRGKKGGLSEYARLVGKSQGNLSSYKQAAEITQKLISYEIGLSVDELLDKARHLAAIHKAPEADWAWLVGELGHGGGDGPWWRGWAMVEGMGHGGGDGVAKVLHQCKGLAEGMVEGPGPPMGGCQG